MAALGHWLSALAIALVATAGGIGCNNGLAAVTASRMGALIATAGSIGCNNGSNGRPHWLVHWSAHWSTHWLQRPAALAVTMAYRL